MARESKAKRDERRFGKAVRLADLILGQHKELCSPATTDGHHDLFSPDQIDGCTFIDAQNIFDYAKAHHENRTIDWRKDIPIWRLPFPAMWVEFRDDRRTFAVMLHSSDPDGGGASPVRAMPFFEARGKVLGPMGVSYVNVNGDGSITELPATYSPFEFMDGLGSNFSVFTTFCMLTAFLTVSFIHCKNVEVSPVEPDRTLNRERRKHGLKPFLRYHTINIEPMKRTLRTEGESETKGLKHALHICRGHFATYSDTFMGRPLASPMTVWRPAHTRGSLKEGVVVSDYKVNAPTTGAAK